MAKIKSVVQPALFPIELFDSVSTTSTASPKEKHAPPPTDGPNVPPDWLLLQQSQQRIQNWREQIEAIQKQALEKRKFAADSGAINELSRRIAQELEATKEIRTSRHQYRGWLLELTILDTSTRLRGVDEGEWLEIDKFTHTTFKADAIASLHALVDEAIAARVETNPPLPFPSCDTESLDGQLQAWTEISSGECCQPSPLAQRLKAEAGVSDPVVERVPDVCDEHDLLQPDTITAPSVDFDSVSDESKEDTESKKWRADGFRPSKRDGYKPKGTARGDNAYYRYSYRDGERMVHVHIPGGHRDVPIVQERWATIQKLKAAGTSHSEIVEMIARWKRSNRIVGDNARAIPAQDTESENLDAECCDVPF